MNTQTSETDPTRPAPSKCHFFELPPELRLRVYSYLLPDMQDHSEARPLAWLRTNRQMLEEALETFYGTGSFGLTIFSRGDATSSYEYAAVTFLTKYIAVNRNDDIATAACLAHVHRIRNLRLTIRTHATIRSLCAIQDFLYAVCRRFGTQSRLRTLQVSLQIDAYRYNHSADGTVRVLSRTIDPEHVSPPIAISFITEPLRMLVISPVVQDCFSLSISGDEGQPLPRLAAEIQYDIRTRRPFSDIQPVLRYFDVLRDSIHQLARVPATRNETDDEIFAAAEKVYTARIRGDMEMMRQHHNLVSASLQHAVSDNLRAGMKNRRHEKDRLVLFGLVFELEEALEALVSWANEIEAEGSM